MKNKFKASQIALNGAYNRYRILGKSGGKDEAG